MLKVILYVNGIKNGNKGYEMKNVTKNETQSVYLAENKLIVKKIDNPVSPFRDADQIDKTNDRDKEHKGTFPISLYERNKECRDNKYKCWRNGINHHSNPPVFS